MYFLLLHKKDQEVEEYFLLLNSENLLISCSVPSSVFVTEVLMELIPLLLKSIMSKRTQIHV